MSCEILIKTDNTNGVINYTHPNSVKDRAVYKKGYPVDIINSPKNFRGFREGIPFFCSLNVTDGNKSDVESLISSNFSGGSIIQEWKRNIDWAVVNSNLTIDGWRMRIFVTNPGFNNLCGITRTMVENFLARWNVTVYSDAQNEVVFDITIYDAITSSGFWNRNISSVVFNEIDYNQGTTNHRISADYSAIDIESDLVGDIVDSKNGTIISNENNIIIFDILRADVFDQFKMIVAKRLKTKIHRRQFKIPESAVDTIISTGTQILIDHYDEVGGYRDQIEYRMLDVTLAQIDNFLINNLNEDL